MDFNRPGHIFPLRAKTGGVLVRPGQTEAILDFAKLADGRPAGVICGIMKDNGTMARTPDLQKFAKKFDLKVCTIESLVAYRQRTERLFENVELNVPMPTRHGTFMLHLFRSTLDGAEHLALTRGIAGPGLMGCPGSGPRAGAPAF